MIPIRCYSCGKVIANKWEAYKTHLEKGISKNDALAEVGMKRYCCRIMFMSHVELTDNVLLYSEIKDTDSE